MVRFDVGAMDNNASLKVIIRGAGEIASGIAHRLHCARLRVCLTEIATPLAVSRGVVFSEAVYEGHKTVMGVTAELVPATVEDIQRVWHKGNIPIIVDPEASVALSLKPDVLVVATMAKGAMGAEIGDAPLVIGVGPGFYAGRDVHAVVETANSDTQGQVILMGEAAADTLIPVEVGGLTKERVVWAAKAGTFIADRAIGDTVAAHEVIGRIGDLAVEAPIGGILRGILRSGVKVSKGSKLLEVDPVHDRTICGYVTGKARAIGAGVLEAITLRYGERVTQGEAE